MPSEKVEKIDGIELLNKIEFIISSKPAEDPVKIRGLAKMCDDFADMACDNDDDCKTNLKTCEKYQSMCNALHKYASILELFKQYGSI